MKYTNTFAQKALVFLAIFAVATFSFIPYAFADDSDYSADSYSVDDSSYSDDSYSPDDYSYSADSYSPDYSSSYSADSYSPDDYSYSADSYSPDYSSSYSADSYSPDYAPSYEAPSVSYVAPSEGYASYVAPSVSYEAPYEGYASYVAPTYVAPPVSYVTYQAPQVAPVVYTTPNYTNASYTYTYPQTQTPVEATCYAENANPYVNENVTWTVNATGGNGTYGYTWSGLGLNGLTGQTVNTSYSSIGNETATVSVFSNGQSVNVTCGSIYVNQYQNNVGNISVACYPNVNSAPVGSTITWTAVVTGGDGDYTYSWLDNNGVGNVSSNSSVYTTTYPIAGEKSPTLTVSSLGYYGNYGSGINNGNNTSETVACQPLSIYTNNYTAGYTYTYPTYPTGNLASLSSVSLNQVPYTGLTDSAGFWEFMVGLFLASLVGTWYFMKVYVRGKRRYMINLFKKNNLAKKMNG